MRVSDRTTARNYLKYLDTAKGAYAKTQEQIASGNRFERISDDVSAGTRVMRTRMDMYQAEIHLDNVKSVNEELSTTESSMQSINDVLGELHGTKLVKALNDPTNTSGREAIANEVSAMRDEILQFANLRYGQRFAFGGSNSSIQAPFSVDADKKLLYNGIKVDEIQKDKDGFFYMEKQVDTNGDPLLDANGDPMPDVRHKIPMNEDVYMDIGLGIKMKGSQIDGDTGFRISYSGLDILGFGKTEDGMSNNIFNIISDIEKNLRNYDVEEIKKLDTQLVKVTDQFRANLTDIGAKTHFLDTIQGRQEDIVSGYKIRINGLMGTNDAEAATTQKMNDYVLKAVIQMGAQLLPVSLMDFIR